MDAHLHQLLRLRDAARQTQPGDDLIACSLCLRVLRNSEWLPAERVIREIRSYQLAAPPQLQPAVCDDCADSIFSRRARLRERIAA